MWERLSDLLVRSVHVHSVQPVTGPHREQAKLVLKCFVFSWDHHCISWMKSDVLLGLFTLNNFVVLKLEARLATIFRAQDHDAVFLGKGSKATCLCDQLKHGGLRVERIRTGTGHLTGNEGALAANLNHGDRNLRIVEKAFQFLSNHVLNL